MYTKQNVILKSASFELLSLGNGAAYELLSYPDAASIWLQDEDATQFRADLDAIETAYPEQCVENTLSQLWGMHT